MINIPDQIFLYTIIQIFFIFGILGISKVFTVNLSYQNYLPYIWNNIFFIIILSTFFGYYYLYKVNNYILSGIIYFISLIGFIFLLKYFNKLKKINFNKYKIVKFFILLYFFLSLSPPTDIDSLDYHIGAPLLIFENKSFFPRFDWLHFRLIGLGENLNFIGIILNTFNIGQIFQFIGLLIVILFSFKYLNSSEKKKYFSLYILSCPLLLFLISSQKFQLFPASLVYISFLYLTYEKNIKRIDIFYISLSLVFIVGCKFSYIIPSFLIWIYLFVKCIKLKELNYLIVITIFNFLVILFFQLYLKNFNFYGDPISPILENFKQVPDENILNFLNFNKTFAINQNNITFLISLLIPSTLGSFTTTLGPILLGVLGINFRYIEKKSKIIVFFSIILFFSIFLIYRGIPRYYIEIYFFIGFIIFRNFEHLKLKNFFKFLVFFQSILIILILIYSNITLTSGIFSKNLRISVFSKKAFGYNIAEWTKQELKKDNKNKNKILLSDIRFYAFFENNFVSHQYLKYGNLSNTKSTILKNKIDYILYPSGSFSEKYFNNCVVSSKKISKEFELMTRNPFNKIKNKQRYFLIKIEKLIC